MFGAEVNKQIRDHADREFPKESCGLVINGVYKPTINAHDNPEEFFTISDVEFIKASHLGLQAIVHSHPNGLNRPTWKDMETQWHSAVPWGVAPKNHAVFWFGDGTPIAPLEGRKFHFGVHDCTAACRDWYRQEKGVVFPSPPREPEWWLTKPFYMPETLQEGGFVIVHDGYQVGDILVMSIGKADLSHCAVVVGEDLIYHHLMNSVSKVEALHRYKDYIALHLRYGK